MKVAALKAGDKVTTPQGPGRYVRDYVEVKATPPGWNRARLVWLVVALDEGGRRFYNPQDVRRVET